MDETLLPVLYYLSSSGSTITNYNDLQKAIQFITGEDRQYFDKYLAHYTQNQVFPDFYHFCEQASVRQACADYNPAFFVTESLPKFKEAFYSYLRSSERRYMETMFSIEQNPLRKKDLVDKLQKLYNQGEVVESIKLTESSSINVALSTTQRFEEGSIVFPVNSLKERCGSAGPGFTVYILGGPGSGKSTLAQNIVFANSVLSNKNTLYFYLEDVMERYQYNIFSRYSYHIGDKVASLSLKTGVSEDDHEALNKIKEIQARYDLERKGKIYYVGINELSNEPDLMARKLAKIINDNEIDILCVDYLQKLKAFRPPKWESMEYLNQMASILNALALGQFNNRKVLSLILSQLNRTAEERVEKTKGKMSLFDGAEVHSIERDSQLVFGIYSSAATREAGEAQIQILKARDASVDITPMMTFFDPPFCFIGDVAALEESYSNETMRNAWNGIEL